MNVSQNSYGLSLSESLNLLYEQAKKEATPERDLTEILQGNILMDMVSKTIQGYVEDGLRNFELKIFKADIYSTSGPPIRHYFVSRIELGYTKVKGNASSYDK